MTIKNVKLYFYKITIVFVTIILSLYFANSIAAKAEDSKNESIKLTGYLIDEHCFEHKSDNPGMDTKECLQMDDCIKGGYGIAVPQKDGSYKFYYFNGKFFTDVKALDGTEGQKTAYDLIAASTKKNHFAVDVTGKVEETAKDSINLKGVTYPVIDVTSLKEATDEEAATLLKTTNSTDANNDSTMKDMHSDKNNDSAMKDSKVSQDQKTGSSITIIYIAGILAAFVVVTLILIKIKKQNNNKSA
ncbi:MULTISPECIES: hypothetical protein [unclassified Clostridium]|uniref:hypothetical protein n=1 Tax=unclassified Clostridium TaxID=2614128 RepID=UPI0002980D6E|nr:MULTISPECIES: hypothetical protein [unclassified Clostridium]EKQ53819.1 MAG: hypothetical protein A370_03565 [Clostridium sp. Maddingley MBC34-26]